MKFIIHILIFGLLALPLSGCIERPENEMVQEAERKDPASGIDVTTGLDGIFIGFANKEKDEMTIEFEGMEKTYPIADDARGDFETLEKGDEIVFFTKPVEGEEQIENVQQK